VTNQDEMKNLDLSLLENLLCNLIDLKTKVTDQDEKS
jgi:hypothetical protein